MSGRNSQLRLGRIVFGTTWNPDFAGASGMFSLDDLIKRYAETYHDELDREFATDFLNSMVTTGYMVEQGNMYGVIMTPLDG